MRTYSEAEVEAAAARAGLHASAIACLRAELQVEPERRGSFEAAHIAYYFGGLLITGAMAWFITQRWDSLPGAVLTAVALVYAAVFGGAGYALSKRLATWVPGGVLMAVAVCMTPLAVYGMERQFGWWPAGDPGGFSRFHPRIDASWVLMEAVTLLVAALALRLVRFPFVMAPAAYALWYLSMDAPQLIAGYALSWHSKCWISVAFGALMLAVGYFADGETDEDFAFWFYLFGLLTFSGGLTFMGGGTELGRAIYCAVHLCLIVLSVVLQRRVFLVVGAVGVFTYLVGEAEHYFRNSFSFTMALTVLGVLLIAAGIFYKRKEAGLSVRFARWIPQRVAHRHA